MKCILDDPRRLGLFARNARQGLARMFSPESPKNAAKMPSYPNDLTRLELAGMLVGPFAYLRERRRAKHQAQVIPALGRITPHTCPVPSEATGSAGSDQA